MVRRLAICLVLGLALAPSASAQTIAKEEAWQPILTHEGVRFAFLFYSVADNFNNGVVVLLVNTNDHAVRYRFKMVFRSAGGDEAVEEVEGELGAGEAKTGDRDGLFWIPFPDGQYISEVGLRGYQVTPGRVNVGTCEGVNEAEGCR